MVSLSEFDRERRGDARIWISRSYLEPAFVDALVDADRLLSGASCRIVKDERKTKVACLTVRIGGVPRSVYLKRYNAVSLYSTLFSNIVLSGAWRSLRGARILNEAGIATPRPVAAVENRRYGVVYKSFFIAEEIANGKTVDAYWKEDLQRLQGGERLMRRRVFINSLAGLFRALHTRQIYHRDLKDANIIVVPGSEDRAVKLFLLDLEGVRLYRRLSERRRLKNLVQLYRTLGQSLTMAQRLFFLRCYLGREFDDRRRRRKMIGGVLKLARQVEELKARRNT